MTPSRSITKLESDAASLAFRRPGFRRRLTAAIVALLALNACGANTDSSSESPDSALAAVVVTTSIWADVVENVTCHGLVDVVTLVPVGADPHAFEPSLADRRAMEDAKAIVANGAFLEEGLLDTVEAAESAGASVFRMADHIGSLESGSDSGGAASNPHVWFDPIRVADSLPALGDFLVSEASIDADQIAACVVEYQQELAELDSEIAVGFAELGARHRRLVTTHGAFDYFADRYGLEVIGTVLPTSSTLAESSPAQLEDLAKKLESAGVSVIFAEYQHADDDAHAVADRVGAVEIVTLFTGSLGDEESGADTYIGFMSTNAGRISAALG